MAKEIYKKLDEARERKRGRKMRQKAPKILLCIKLPLFFDLRNAGREEEQKKRMFLSLLPTELNRSKKIFTNTTVLAYTLIISSHCRSKLPPTYFSCSKYHRLSALYRVDCFFVEASNVDWFLAFLISPSRYCDILI